MLPVKSSLIPTVSRFFDDDWINLFDWSNRNYSQPFSTLPSVNILENGESYLVEMAAPGLKKDDFQIELHNNTLTIKSDAKGETREEQERYALKEFGYHSFKRSFTLNHKVVDDSKIKATYDDGILRLILPKKEEAKEKPARLIKIS